MFYKHFSKYFNYFIYHLITYNVVKFLSLFYPQNDGIIFEEFI